MLALSQVTSSAAMKLSSPDFKEGEKIPERFTCEGKDIKASPQRANQLRPANCSSGCRARSVERFSGLSLEF
jgi:phosphatidylethanolamine-binding protein (PEBP) family uncharacterized protein